ncbi:MAG TPA: DUF2914 domain-containing protein, partial [Sorangium sp.]|nr:DUF2914 domain-containing protein [Sorangium sp.]
PAAEPPRDGDNDNRGASRRRPAQVPGRSRRIRKPRKRYASTKPKLARNDGAGSDTAGRPAHSDPAAPDVEAPTLPLRVNRLVISSGVSGREPTGAANRFEAGAQRRIYAFLEVNNPNDSDSKVVVTFYPEGGRQRGGITMKVGPSRRWRTWATTRRATKPGVWHAVVHDLHGKVLARTSFEISAPASATKPKDKAPETATKVSAGSKGSAK